MTGPAPTIARGEQLAAQLLAAGIPCTLDPTRLAGQAPCLLIAPPRLAFDASTPTATWRLVAVASLPYGLAAWQQLDELVALVAEQLPVELAEPVSFANSPTDDPMPAYALTLTT